MTQTVTDLGKLVKAKYPGSYDDITDDEVGKRVKAKFPGSYDDFTDAAPTPTPAAKPPDARNATEVMQDQAAGVTEGLGIKDFIDSPMGTLKRLGAQFQEHSLDTAASAVWNIVKAPVVLPYEGAKGATTSIIANIKNLNALNQAKGLPSSGVTLDAATPEENKEAAVGAGQFGQAAPVIAGELTAGKAVWDKAKTALTTPKVPISAADINKWIDVPAKEVMHGANPGEQLLKDGLMQDTKAATKSAVQSQLNAAGKEMEAHLAKATKDGITIDAQTPTYDGVAKATKRIGTPRDATFQAQMNGIVDDIEARYPNLHKLTPTEAHALKVELGDSIKWSGQAYDTPANQAMISIYRDLNAAIKNAVPGIEATQARWGNLFIANKNLAESLAEDVVGKGSGAAAPTAVTPLDRLKQLGKKYGPPLALGAAGAKGVQIYHDWNRP